MRPMLALLIARACSAGQVSDSTISFAAASELLHNATLLHDDVADGSFDHCGSGTALTYRDVQLRNFNAEKRNSKLPFR